MINTEKFYPMRKILNRCGDKWSVLVLLNLKKSGVVRFNELKRNIPSISQKMLTATLRKLEADQLIERTIYPEVPPRVEYQLTEAGKSLLPHIQGLINWALFNKW
jgi:DNA-binding HxlR family transcriptional regulator